MPKKLKVKFKDFNPKEKRYKVIQDIIGGIIFIPSMIGIIWSITQQLLPNLIFFIVLIAITMPPMEIYENRLKKRVRIRKEQYIASAKEKEGKVDLKNVLKGMAKSTGEIDLKYLSKQLNKDVEKLRLFVYELVGSTSLDGKMEGDKFILSDNSDIDYTIDTLLKTYEEWEIQDKGKI